MAHSLPALDWSLDALAPVLSTEQLDFHYNKHHNTYIVNLNKLLDGTGLEGESLESLITNLAQVPEAKRTAVFNNAAQHFNHSFYWKSLSPKSAGPGPKTIAALTAGFGSVDDFKKQFSEKAVTVFGSGWAWLVKKADGSLAIQQTSNAGCPLTDGNVPLLTFDVWEHASSVDYRNLRAKYCEEIWKIVNWEHIESRV